MEEDTAIIAGQLAELTRTVESMAAQLKALGLEVPLNAEVEERRQAGISAKDDVAAGAVHRRHPGIGLWR